MIVEARVRLDDVIAETGRPRVSETCDGEWGSAESERNERRRATASQGGRE